MILAIDVDNARINIGIFENEIVATRFSVATDTKKTSDEYAVTFDGILDYYRVEKKRIEGVIMCSVVPQITDIIAEAIKKLICNIDVIIVGNGTKTGFPIKIDNPTEMGTDLVANAAAVLEITAKEGKNGSPCIIIDMGTATTIFALNCRHEYIGGCILPGIGMSFDVLHGKTALIPNVSPVTPVRAIGRNSQESVRSGVILGNALMIDGFIKKFSDEIKCNDNTETFITGEYAHCVISSCKQNMRYIPELTLNGLYRIYKNNIKSR